MNTLVATVEIWSAWIAVFILQSGVGFLLSPRLRRGRWGTSAINAFWLGLAAVIGFLQIFQMLAPVGVVALALFAAAGVAGTALAVRGREPADASRHLEPAWRLKVPLVLGIGAALWYSNSAIQGAVLGDSGLYHSQAVHWLQDYSIVPGLGNLHARFAFNSSTLLYDALLGVWPWHYGGHHVANSLLLTVLTLDLLWRARPLLSRALSPTAITACLFLPAVVIRAQYQSELSSPSLDLPAMVVVAAALPRMIGWSRRDNSSALPPDVVVAVALFSLLPTMRIQLAPLALVCLVAIFLVGRGSWLRRLSLVGAPALMVLPWLVRNVFLSGYLVFPATIVSVPVSWRLPRWYAGATLNAIRDWARQPGPRYLSAGHGWHWLGAWWRSNLRLPDVQWPLALLVGSIALALCVLFVTRGSGARVRNSTLMVLVAWVACALTTVVWFLTGPDPRFALGALWGLGAVSVAIAVCMLPQRATGLAALGVIAISALLTSRELISAVRHDQLVRGTAATRSHLVPDPTDPYTTVPIPGGTIRMPIGTDQCHDAPLPCTPEHEPGLRYRSPGRPGDGFVIAP